MTVTALDEEESKMGAQRQEQMDEQDDDTIGPKYCLIDTASGQ